MSYQTPYPAPPPQRPNSSMAVVSLVSGILGFTLFPFIGSIIALITGSMARKEIRQSMGALAGEGLATAGIIMGWIGVAIGIIGCCIAFFSFLLPLILVALGVSIDEYGFLLPIWLGIF